MPPPVDAVGRGQGPPRLAGDETLRRAAAAADAGARPVAPPGDPLPRRVLDRDRPGDDDAHRGHPARAEAGDDDHLGHQPAPAGAADRRHDRVPERLAADRGRPDRKDVRQSRREIDLRLRHGELRMTTAAHTHSHSVVHVDVSAAAAAGAARTAAAKAGPATATVDLGIETNSLNLWYAKFQALKNVTLNIRPGIITSL